MVMAFAQKSICHKNSFNKDMHAFNRVHVSKTNDHNLKLHAAFFPVSQLEI